MFCGAMALLIAFVAIISNQISISEPGILFQILAGVLGVFVFPLLTIIKGKKQFEEFKNSNKEINYEFSYQNFVISSDISYSDNKWTAVKKVVESKKFYLLYYNDTILNAVFKKYISAQDDKLLRKMIESNKIKIQK